DKLCDFGRLVVQAEQLGDASHARESFGFRLATRTQDPLKQPENLAALVRIVRQHLGNGCKRSFLVDQQHVELLAHQSLEVSKRQNRQLTLLPADTADG